VKVFLAGLGAERCKALQSASILVAVSLVSAIFSLFLVDNFSILTRLDQFVQDWEIASVFAPREEQDPKIVIVAVDEATLTQFPYRSPVDRAFLSTLIRQIAAHHPAAIESDFLLDQPTENAKDKTLAATLRETKVPLVISYIASHDIVTQEQKSFEDAMVPPSLRALVNLPTDQFDTARDVFPGAKVGGHYIPGVARAVAARIGVETPEKSVPIVWRGRPAPTDLDPRPKPFVQYSAAMVANPALSAVFDVWFKDKIVLIGSDVTLVDRHRTPFSVLYAGEEGQLPGIVIQAHALSQLIHHKQSPIAGWQLNFAVTLALALLGASLAVVNASLWMRAVVVLLLLPVFASGGVALYHYANVILSLMAPSLALVVSFFSMEALSGREARKQKAFIQGAFARYVSPKLVEQMTEDPSRMSLKGERRVMTYLFSDIQDFTTMSEKMESEDLARLVNGYLDGMTEIVLKHDGMVDKFIGDAVFAVFNAPLDLADHAQEAVQCMLEMDLFTEKFRAEQAALGVLLGVTRIGVHTGPAVIGNFGSQARFTYTAQGDAVNTASRLEGINKYLGTRLCVSDATRLLCHDIAFRPIASVVLKGKTEALDLWEPLHEADARLEFLAAYGAAYDRLKQEAPDAATLFSDLSARYPDDPCIRLHAGRLKDGAAGVTMVMTEK